ncbi:hypothetical protein JD844_018927 [Phrynosoma platyrhinos]|uniref:Uncharacterized protein n=1 Tax=Phrynosoma platyrhinos TaxID=52577 RepID=A0ABQ7SPA3_PHRPL|nr:hypothetical protein JD844_018927 [Phrynosoma platyrhinos]
MCCEWWGSGFFMTKQKQKKVIKILICELFPRILYCTETVKIQFFTYSCKSGKLPYIVLREAKTGEYSVKSEEGPRNMSQDAQRWFLFDKKKSPTCFSLCMAFVCLVIGLREVLICESLKLDSK